MKTLISKFSMEGGQLLDERARDLLRDNDTFQTLTQNRGEQAWGGTVPATMVFMAEVQGTAVFMTVEWEVTIYGGSLIDCVGSMCAVLNTLRRLFDSPVEVELLDTPQKSSTLARQLGRERFFRRCRTFGIWILTSIVAAFMGALIQKYFFA